MHDHPATSESPTPAPAKATEPPATITATPEQILEAIDPVRTIIEEKWPLGFQGGYWVGKLLKRLHSEQKAIETGRQALLREYAKTNEDGVLETRENGSAVFAEGQFQLYQARLKTDMATPLVIDGVRPIRTSDFSKEVHEKLNKESFSGAALGLLDGTPFLVQDAPLFTT